jgi:hypothetical protein
MRTTILAAIMLALPGAAAEQQQFDLICTAKKDSVRYRVDLAAKRYCAGDCRAVRPIVDVSATELVLERHEPAFRTDITSRTIINRSTGGWQTYVDIPGTGVPFSRDGSCEPAPFSGLPTAKF